MITFLGKKSSHWHNVKLFFIMNINFTRWHSESIWRNLLLKKTWWGWNFENHLSPSKRQKTIQNRNSEASYRSHPFHNYWHCFPEGTRLSLGDLCSYLFVSTVFKVFHALAQPAISRPFSSHTHHPLRCSHREPRDGPRTPLSSTPSTPIFVDDIAAHIIVLYSELSLRPWAAAQIYNMLRFHCPASPTEVPLPSLGSHSTLNNTSYSPLVVLDTHSLSLPTRPQVLWVNEPCPPNCQCVAGKHPSQKSELADEYIWKVLCSLQNVLTHLKQSSQLCRRGTVLSHFLLEIKKERERGGIKQVLTSRDFSS